MKREDNREVRITLVGSDKPVKQRWIHITEIDSTNVKELLYNKVNKLIVEFHHGGKHEYSDVTPEEFESIVAAESIGKKLREVCIITKKPSYKIE